MDPEMHDLSAEGTLLSHSPKGIKEDDAVKQE
jgi:hypothetical protein